METQIPQGFIQIVRPGGFGEAFGPVYFNRDTMALGFRVARNHTNHLDVCHGGALATFADMQIAALVHSGLASDKLHLPTISLSIDYIAVVPLGAWIELSVSLVKKTKKLIFTQALITADGTTAGRANAIYRNYEGSSAKVALSYAALNVPN